MTPLTQDAASVRRMPVIRRLRRLVPEQALPFSWRAAERIAEHQATLLRRLAHTASTDPVALVKSLPAITIRFEPSLPHSSTSHWDQASKTWIVQILASRGAASRRFLILHELKQILDHGRAIDLYDPHFRRGPVQAQMASDHFAACVLMPARELRHAVRTGTTSISALARHFDVPEHRVMLRLNDLDLINHITDKH